MSVERVRIEVGVFGRWDACALLERLAPYRSFLIQLGPEQWVVHAQTPGCRGENAETALTTIEECLDERRIDDASVRVDGKPYRTLASAGARS